MYRCKWIVLSKLNFFPQTKDGIKTHNFLVLLSDWIQYNYKPNNYQNANFMDSTLINLFSHFLMYHLITPSYITAYLQAIPENNIVWGRGTLRCF